MRLRTKLLVAGIVVAGLVLTPAASFFAIHSADAPPPEDADLRVAVPEVPPEENGFPLIQRAAKAVFWLDEDQWLDGHPPEGADDDALTDGQRLDRMVGGEAWDNRLAAGVLERNREALALFEEGMARPHFQLPRITSLDDLIPYLFDFIQLGNLLTLRSRAHGRAGEAEEAFETALRLLRFGGRVERASNCLVAYLVGLTLRRMGLGLLREYAAEMSLPPDALREYADRLAACPPSNEGLARAIRAEYLLMANAVDQVSRGEMSLEGLARGPSAIENITPPLAYRLHPNRTKRMFADTFRTLIDAAGQPYCKARPRGEAWERGLDERHARLSAHWWSPLRPNAIGETMYCLLMPGYKGLFRQKAQSELSLRVTRLMLLLRAYKTARGRLPERLDVLVPATLDAVPTDPFDGKPLRYDPEKRILYSVGRDGEDTGGLSEEEAQRWWQEEYPYKAEEGMSPAPWEMPDPSFPLAF